MTPDEQLAALCTPTEEEATKLRLEFMRWGASDPTTHSVEDFARAVLRLAVPRIAAQVLRDAAAAWALDRALSVVEAERDQLKVLAATLLLETGKVGDDPRLASLRPIDVRDVAHRAPRSFKGPTPRPLTLDEARTVLSRWSHAP